MKAASNDVSAQHLTKELANLVEEPICLDRASRARVLERMKALEALSMMILAAQVISEYLLAGSMFAAHIAEPQATLHASDAMSCSRIGTHQGLLT